MKKLLALFTLLCGSTVCWAQNGSDRTGDFALLDHLGTFHQMSWYSDREALVLMTYSSQCALDRNTADDISRLATEFEPQGFEFMLINVDGNPSRQQIGSQITAIDLALPVLMDDSQLVAETLGITHSGEVIILDPERLSILYRGTIADDLARTVSRLASDEMVDRLPGSSQPGCPIEFLGRDRHTQSPPSYVADVAPILAQNCASCHREGGIAPFAMDSHLMVKGWSPMMRETLLTKRMPPGQIDPHIGKFDALDLSVEDTQTLVHWIDAGAPRDGDKDPLEELDWNDSRWPLGEPDMIVKVPPTEIPATGSVPYIWVDSGIVLEEDRWLRGSELLPGDPSVVHHVISVAVPPHMDGPQLGICPNPCESGDRDPREDGIRLQGYVPGINPELAGDSAGTLVEAGSRFVFQMHYTTSGRSTTDASELGLYFHPRGFEPTEQLISTAALNNDFVIPPNVERHSVDASFTVPMDAALTSFSPHMHVRGQSMKFSALYPDGSKETLLSVPHYDFNWQRTYRFTEPKPVPAGTTILVEGSFDNSARNLANPAPGERVHWGDQSWEEMFIGFMALKVSSQMP